ncbi:Ig-like domain-containing protein [Leptospira ellisii]|uniref:Ig-like domain-containing protein n=4 Tax=Leptospira ellisii TaxID=2023197 RepID=A0AAE4QKK7_9LEPT|nr:Ig-like domain-containing protein [Leptospira ellisii]MDV6234520.1 Ig-like domain-containing protein [Leptospira ellisii]
MMQTIYKNFWRLSRLSWIALFLLVASCEDKKQSDPVESTLPLLTFASEGTAQPPGSGGNDGDPSSPGLPSFPGTPATPTVSSTTPGHTSNNVPINAKITVNFSKTVTAASVTTNSGDTNCSGTIQVSSDDFATCVRMNSAPVSPSGGNHSIFQVTPAALFTTNTQYKLRIDKTVSDESGNEMPETVVKNFTTSASADITAPLVQTTLPTQGDFLVGTGTSVAFQFNEPMDPASLTVNTVDGVCTGSIQFTEANSNVCRRMIAQPVFFNGNRGFSIKPAATLLPTREYTVKITTAAKDAAGNPLNASYTLRFFPQNNDANPPLLNLVFPDDNKVNIARNRVITLDFTEKIDPKSFALNSSNNNCSGSVQISSDNFASCVRFKDHFRYDNPSSPGLRHTLLLQDILAPQTNYKIRLTNGIRDLSGNALGGYTQANGFTTGNDVDNTAPTIQNITPADGSANVSTTLNVDIRFNEEMNPNLLTGFASGNQCSANIQISKDDFATCVNISGMTIFLTNDRVRLSANGSSLQSNTTYKVRIKGSVRDAADNGLAGGDFTQTTGFTTAP